MLDSTHGTDGLAGEWLTLEQLGALPFFAGKRLARRLVTNLDPAADGVTPTIKAAVRRQYPAGAVICRAGEYGSTAFLLLEGAATATLGENRLVGHAGLPGERRRPAFPRAPEVCAD